MVFVGDKKVHDDIKEHRRPDHGDDRKYDVPDTENARGNLHPLTESSKYPRERTRVLAFVEFAHSYVVNC